MSFRIAFIAVFFAAWAAFAWWSWRAVRRRGFAPRYGMTPFGGVLMFALAVQQSLDRVDAAALADASWMPGFWRQLPLQLFIVFPLAVWADFFFGRLFRSGMEGMGFRMPPEG